MAASHNGGQYIADGQSWRTSKLEQFCLSIVPTFSCWRLLCCIAWHREAATANLAKCYICPVPICRRRCCHQCPANLHPCRFYAICRPTVSTGPRSKWIWEATQDNAVVILLSAHYTDQDHMRRNSISTLGLSITPRHRKQLRCRAY